MGRNLLKILLLAPITDTRSLPAQLLAQGSPKIPSKDRDRFFPEALSKCKVSLFSSNLIWYFWFNSVSLKAGPGGCCVPNRSQSQGSTEGTGTSVIPVVALGIEVGNNLSPGTVFLLLKPPPFQPGQLPQCRKTGFI